MKRHYYQPFVSIFLFAWMMVLPCFAKAAVYQIELIVFSHFTPKSVTQEQWPKINPSAYAFPNAISLKPSANGYHYFTELAPNRMMLNREALELEKNPNYQVLMHLAWLQPVYAHANTIQLTTHSLPSNSRTKEINGVMRISVERYFDVHFNLLFAVPGSRLSSLARNDYFNGANTVYFHLNEMRRMRSNELNYIDYPLYGILIKIKPIHA